MKFTQQVLIVFAMLFAVAAGAQPAYRNHSLIRVRVESEERLRALYRLSQLDIIDGDSRLTPYIAAYPEDLPLLQQHGYVYEVLQENLEAFYASRLTSSPVATMGGYRTYSEIVAVMDSIHNAHPNITTAKFSIGNSLEGRAQWVMKISDNPQVDEDEPEVFYNSLIHAREPAAMEAVIYFMNYLTSNYGSNPQVTELVNNRELYFLPCLNPDGYEYNRITNPNGGGMWRKNRRNNGDGSYGVDLNRNFGLTWGLDNEGSSPIPSDETYRGTAPFSEPETQNVRDFINSRHFVTAIDYHTYSNLVLYPWGTSYYDGDGLCADNATFEMIADSMAYWIATVNGVWYTTGTPWQLLYNTNGGSFDWEYGETTDHSKMYAVTTEVGSPSDGFWPPTNRILPLAQENLPANLFMARIANTLMPRPYAVQTIGQSATEFNGNGNGALEPGESFEFSVSLRNIGTEALNDLNGQLSAADAFATVTQSQSPWPDLPSNSSGANQTTFRVAISAGCPQLHDLTLNLRLTDPAGLDTTFPLQVLVAGIIQCYDFETDQGWTVGAAGDGATSGIWERGDPQGTSVNGPVQPEDDHTPAPGVNCYVSGAAAGASPGANDIDGGRTTLNSPVWDLSGYNDVMLDLWSWYSNDQGNAPSQDTLRMDISSDGGATWVNLIRRNLDWEYWRNDLLRLSNFITLTNQVKLRIVAADLLPGSLVEAAVDDVCLRGGVNIPVAPSSFTIAYRPESGQLLFRWNSTGAQIYRLYSGTAPEGPFETLVASTTGTSTAISLPASGILFYVVIAENP